ncbi:MAG TPA: zinc-finger domain-containing protein [Aestuariivirgaceae bacterium]|nr:zinc-finger domain-containing protein [Aestuariivirgaceae bacterium]
MAGVTTPKYHNEMGVPVIHVGSREFNCVGAMPPFDHPHIYIDMGDESEAVCAYCSTLYRYDPALNPAEAHPADAVYIEG